MQAVWCLKFLNMTKSGVQFALAFPNSKFWGTCPLPLPRYLRPPKASQRGLLRPVNDAALVNVVKRRDELSNKIPRDVLGQSSVLLTLDVRQQFAALRVLGHQAV